MLKTLSPRMAAREHMCLRSIKPELAEAYAYVKQLYIKHFPNGPRPMMAEGHRDNAVQAHYYAQGRTTPGSIITYKKPGTSKHNKMPSEAFDVWMIGDDGEVDWTERNYKDFAGLMHEYRPEIVWGGNFKTLKDLPHYETR